MRNFTRVFHKSPKPTVIPGAGFTNPLPVQVTQRDSGLEPERHFTPVAVAMETPPHVFVDLDETGRREVMDARD